MKSRVGDIAHVFGKKVDEVFKSNVGEAEFKFTEDHVLDIKVKYSTLWEPAPLSVLSEFARGVIWPEDKQSN